MKSENKRKTLIGLYVTGAEYCPIVYPVWQTAIWYTVYDIVYHNGPDVSKERDILGKFACVIAKISRYFNVSYTKRLCCRLPICENCYWCKSVTVIPQVNGHRIRIISHRLFVWNNFHFNTSVVCFQIAVSWPASALLWLTFVVCFLWAPIPEEAHYKALRKFAWVWTVQYNTDVNRHIMFLHIIKDLKAFTLYSPSIVLCIVKLHLMG